MSAEQAAKMYARRAAAKAEALAEAIETTVEDNIIKPVLEVTHDVVARFQEDDEVSVASSLSSAAGTPVEEIDSGIELEEVKSKEGVGKASAVQVVPSGQGVQTRARSRRA